ncbi:MAG TPA: ABC transporter substrate-binding protein, partial [Thermoplasmata archaeon]|nr:ABC transporter substrate-binding protein [Thermoplasmata archaeon]
MRVGYVRGFVAVAVVCLAAALVVSGFPTVAAELPRARTRAGELFLIVGGQDQMKTRNLLPASANDVWTSDVHYRAYHSLILGHPTLDQPMAYIGKGVDVNENWIFEPTEYDQWRKDAGTDILDVVVYYDFNGVEWHDGTPMTVWDVLFSYHVAAMNARFNTDLRVLYCTSLESASYEGCGRQLSMEVHDADGNPANGYQKNWQNEGGMAGDPAKRVAIRYRLNQPFALFYESTLFPVMMPMHVWSRTGGGRHASSDFGCAVWIPPTEAADRGIPACGNTNAAKWGDGITSTDTVPGSSPYQYTRAEQWNVQDADVIGNGPFEFDTWSSGIEAKVVRYERYYTGVDPDDPSIVYDPQLAKVLKKPTIDGIRFKVFSTTQLGVFALQNGDIDYYHWNVGADFVADLLKVPEIAVEANAEPGFFYMAYNL